MELRELLIQLAAVNARLEVKDGRLHVNAPEGALTPTLREAMKENRDLLIAELQGSKPVQAAQKFDQIEPDAKNLDLEFPLNDVQHAYFIGRHFGIELGNVATHFYFELEGRDLDLDRLQSSFRRVIAHHGMLRSTVSPDGQQRILPTVPDYEIATYDLRGEPAAEQERQTAALRAEMSQQVLPADEWPLFDIRAARLSETETRLYFSWDCLVVDAWSLSIIFKQWHACYLDRHVALPPLEVSFRDYILAELALKDSDRYRLARDYWWARLDRLPSAPILPISKKIDPAKKYPFVRRNHRLAADKWRTLKGRAQTAGITPTSLLLAAFTEVLTFWSKNPHYCLNLTLFNRLPLHRQVNDLVGDFTSLSVLEVDSRRAKTFLDRALTLQRQFLKDLEHREVNGVEVLRELAKRRDNQGKATMPIVFTSTLMVGGQEDQDMGVLQKFGEMSYGLSQTPQVLLDYQIFEFAGELVFNWDSVDTLFLPGVLEDMFHCQCQLLDFLADSPEAWDSTRVVSLPAAQQQVLLEANRTAAEVSDELLHTPFIQQAIETPERVAIQCSAGPLTYGELLATSDEIAQQLLANDARPNELVAVVMDKGWEQVAAVLGILISGAAYLPISASLPERRRAQLLAQSEARIIITQERLMDDLSWPEGLHRVAVSRRDAFEPVTAPPPRRQNASDLAYVIFTSGSTGTPKGVVIDHQAAVNTVVHINRLFEVNADDKVLAVSSLSFDLSVYDIFGLLAVGGCIVIPDGKSEKEAADWQELIQSHGVTIWNSAPPLMDMLVDTVEARQQRLEPIRLAMLSGDWIATSLPDRIQSLTREPQVISLGGATEGSIWSIYYPIAPDVPKSWERIPYGKALPNQHMYVLDKNFEPCPTWVVGDIYIGGKGVALGYWKDEAKTTERFMPHPKTGERLYWTGDLGRTFPDGNIEFLGREDQQVKLHGHRVELGEITANLQMHPDVDDGVVQLFRDGDRDLLTAYLVPASHDQSQLFEVDGIKTSAADAAWQALETRGRRRLAEVCETDHDGLASFDEFWRRAETLCKLGMAETLRRLEVFSEGLRESDLTARLTDVGVTPQHVPLVRQWLKVLRADGMLAEQDGLLVLTDEASSQAFDAASQALTRFIGQTPRYRDFYDYIETSLRHQVELLKGEITALEILFADGSWDLAEALYETNPVAAALSQAMAGALDGLLESWPDDKAIRILEVGAGTGGVTGSLLPRLPADRTEYWYTDLSSFFLSGAKEKFRDYSFIKHGMFDINRSAAEQGYHAHGFDAIVADNVLHNATDVEATLSQLRQLLRPGGHLLILEGTENTPWQMVTVAYLEGFGEHDDGTVHDAELPLIGAEEWRQHLGAAGYEKVATLPQSPAPTDAESGPAETYLRRSMPQHVIVAQAPSSVRRFSSAGLIDYLGARLPEYMIPTEFVTLDRMPLNVNGKVDVNALPRPQRIHQARERKIVAPRTETEQTILAIWKEVLGVDQIGVNENFFEMGGDSLLLTKVLGKINASMGHALTSAHFFAYPTVQSLTRYLTGDSASTESPKPAARARTRSGSEGSRDIAIVGLAGRFPDAPGVSQLWDNVRSARCSIRTYSDEELSESGVDAETLKQDNYVKAGVPLADADLFDAGFFGMSPREAEIMDPQQRFLLECSVEALETAGHVNEVVSGRIGVFVGKDTSRYLLYHLLPNPRILATMGTLAVMNVNEKDYGATQISYRLNLTGPSLNVNTACSSSLVAVHEACQSLLDGECEVALAGGVSIDITQPNGYFFKKGYISSPDGCCRAFSADANGTVGGSGVALVVLKSLDAAQADGDTIHAVIKGSAINNDGSLKVAYSAPSVSGQAQVIADALEAAEVDASTIDYVETHGTGTKLGDPIEIAALNQVYGQLPRASCAIGSIKTNVGHLDAAAGATGLIKAVEAMKHRYLPPSLHFSAPNPEIDFDGGPFYVNTKLRRWDAGPTPRRAAVSSFGVGGTNAHVILEEAPEVAPREETAPVEELLIVSAKRADSLQASVLDLGQHLIEHDQLSMADVAFTLQAGRNAYAHRTFLVCEDSSEAMSRMASPESLPVFEMDASRTPQVVFMFPGQGAGDFDVTWELYQEETVFRDSLDRCAQLVEMYIGADIRAIIYPQWPEEMAGDLGGLNQTVVVQPVLFALEYSLAKWWQSLGVEPEAMIGHSLGEYVAACLAGVFTLEEALSLIVVRGQLMQSMPAGRMAAIGLPETELQAQLATTQCDLAAVNGPEQCVISGPEGEVSALCQSLAEEGVRTRMLKTTRAFHSRMMEPILETYEDCLNQVKFGVPATPFLSNVTGQWITDAEAMSPAYWVRHLRHTVRFSDGLQQLLKAPGRILLEVGPGSTLSSLAKTHGPVRSRVVTMFPTSQKAAAPRRSLLSAVGELWARGLGIDWLALQGHRHPRRVVLPTYRFDRQRYWVPRNAAGGQSYGDILAMGSELGGDLQAEPVEAPGPSQATPAQQESDLTLYPRPYLETPLVAPERDIEKQLVGIWQQYLGIETIGIDDDFFDLGGDSLTATQVNAHLGKELEVEVPIEKIFELVTVRQLADYILLFSGELDIDSLSEEELDKLLAVAEA